MTLSTEQQRKMLECAAKACGINGYLEQRANGSWVILNEFGEGVFDPINNPADTAEMCAELGIGNRWYLLDDLVVCGPSYNNVTAYFKDHDNSRLNAWMFAATMVGACIGGYQDEN